MILDREKLLRFLTATIEANKESKFAIDDVFYWQQQAIDHAYGTIKNRIEEGFFDKDIT